MDPISTAIAESLPPPVLAQWDRRIQAVDEYVNAVRHLEQVSGIFVDDSNGLTVYTIYRGERRQARAAIYDTYRMVMKHFPDLLIDFHALPSDSADAILVPESAHKVFPD